LLNEAGHSHNYNPALLERLLLRVSKRWIAGYTALDAIKAAQTSVENGMYPILNYLGEENTHEGQISRTIEEYTHLLDLLNLNKIHGAISVKPSQIGLAINYDTCLENILKISECTKKYSTFLWIDIESFKYVENTFSLYLDTFRKNNQVGVVIQAYLKRSYSDLMHLVEKRAHVRIVKGAYTEDESKAFHSSQEIDRNFSLLMRFMFEHAEGGEIIAIATHDSKLIEEAVALHKPRKSKLILQFQLLKGIRDELKKTLVQKKYSVWEYIPYGDTWLPYSIRRIRERKRNIILLARSLIQS
jgi:proline dehydrogenase